MWVEKYKSAFVGNLIAAMTTCMVISVRNTILRGIAYFAPSLYLGLVCQILSEIPLLNFEPDEELQQTFCSTPGKFCVLLNYCQTGINGECLKRHKGNCIRYKCKFSKFRQCSLLYDTPSHNKETRIVFYIYASKKKNMHLIFGRNII